MDSMAIGAKGGFIVHSHLTGVRCSSRMVIGVDARAFLLAPPLVRKEVAQPRAAGGVALCPGPVPAPLGDGAIQAASRGALRTKVEAGVETRPAAADTEEAGHGRRARLMHGVGAPTPVDGDREQTPHGVEAAAHAALLPRLGRPVLSPATGAAVAAPALPFVLRIKGDVGLVGEAVAEVAASQAAQVLRARVPASAAGAAPDVAQAAAPQATPVRAAGGLGAAKRVQELPDARAAGGVADTGAKKARIAAGVVPAVREAAEARAGPTTRAVGPPTATRAACSAAPLFRRAGAGPSGAAAGIGPFEVNRRAGLQTLPPAVAGGEGASVRVVAVVPPSLPARRLHPRNSKTSSRVWRERKGVQRA